MAKLKKGSAAAKAFMAKLRAARGKTKVVKAKAKTKKVVKAKIVKTKAKKVGATDFTFKRIDNDVNGNPRYVTSFSNLLTDKENYESGLSVADKYDLAARKAKKIGGKKYNTKQFGGGIVFQSYNIEDTEKRIKSLLNEKVGAVKKVMPAKKASSMHKDTKSHNVNIRVVSGIAKSKETQFYEIIKDNNLIQYFNTYGKTYAKFNANVKTNIATGKKSISPLAIEFYKKIENLPLKFTAKPIGKKTKHFEYIDGKNQDTYHQLTEYKVTI